MKNQTVPTKLRSGDEVIVIAGKDIGKKGTLREIQKSKNKGFVTGINMVKKHTKPSAQSPQGGIVEKEAPMHISNLSLLTSKGEATRVGYKMEGDKKVRFSTKSNEVI